MAEENPALLGFSTPHGWVIDDAEGRPAAFLGNFVQRAVGRAGDWRSATGFSLIVGRQARGGSRALLCALRDQGGIDLAFSLNANPLSAPIFRHVRFAPARAPTDRLKLSWRLKASTVALARLARAVADAAPNLIDQRRELFCSPDLARADFPPLPVDVRAVQDLSDTGWYARFWATLKAEAEVIGDRSPEVLRWRFGDPDLTRPPVFLGVWDGRDLVAVGMALMAKQRPIDPAVLEVLDLQALPGAAAHAFPRLMAAFALVGRWQGAAKLRLPVVNAGLIQALGPWAATARREGGWGHAQECWLDPAAPMREVWRPTPFDGDYSFCLRPAPLGSRRPRPSAAASMAPAARKA